MATATSSLNTKITVEEKEAFQRNTEALGPTPSAAIKIFVHMFNEYGGFPFELRRPTTQSMTYLSPQDFQSFCDALDEPMPEKTRELLNRNYERAK